MSVSPPICAVLLDIDGTLVDSNDANARAWEKAMREAGLKGSYEAIRKHIGMGGDQLLPAVAGVEKSSPKGKAASDAWKRIYTDEELPGIRPFPDVRPLIEALSGREYILVAATSSEKELAEKAVKIAGIDDLLDNLTSSADADKSKPHPDILAAALKKIGRHGENVPPDEVILIGDTPFDIEAARRAGLRGTIAFRCGGFTDEELKGALAIYDGPADLLARLPDSVLHAGAVGA